MPVAVLGLASLSSCSDWLDLKPQTSIIAEDMWKDQSDVEAVVASMYRGMIQNDFMERVMAWGELRSDNLLQNDSKKADYSATYELYKSVSMSSILETNSLTSWSSVYNVINLANYVIKYAPDVCGQDADYTTSEMLANVAEARTVRALCYFYLIRTFKEVPYITEPTVDDEQELKIAATPGSEVLSKIIEDLEIAHSNARTNFPTSSGVDQTKFRITRNAASALLADVLLWKASDPDIQNVTTDTTTYNRVIDLCDEVFAAADTANISSSIYTGSGTSTLSMCKTFLSVFSASSSASTEDIFALYSSSSTAGVQDPKNNDTKNNSYLTINKWYGTSSSNDGLAYVTTSMYVGQQDKYTLNAGYLDKQTVFNVAKTSDATGYNDQRYTYSTSARTSTGADVYYINKYMPTIVASSSNDGDAKDNYPSWIFYRLADIYLMRAEARIEKENEAHLTKDANGKIVYPSQIDSIGYAVNMGRALSDIGTIYNRSNKTKFITTSITNDNLSELCLAERRREFLFEGKRWFDLLRAARRKYKVSASGYANYVANFVTTKLSDGLVTSRLNSMDALYWPFYRDEMKRNSKLVQNPYYKSESDNIEKN